MIITEYLNICPSSSVPCGIVVVSKAKASWSVLAMLRRTRLNSPLQATIFIMVAAAMLAFGSSVGAQVTISSSMSLSNGTQGQIYSQTLTANGGIGPYTWTVDGGALPNDVLLSSSGVLSGTPTASGPFSFTLRVVDSTPGTPLVATKAFALTVTRSCADFVDALINWIKGAGVTEERFAWFVLLYSQSAPQFVGYVRGRLDYWAANDELSGWGGNYSGNEELKNPNEPQSFTVDDVPALSITLKRSCHSLALG
jgi:Putative Ig domain